MKHPNNFPNLLGDVYSGNPIRDWVSFELTTIDNKLKFIVLLIDCK